MVKIDGMVENNLRERQKLPRIFGYMFLMAILLEITTACGKQVSGSGVTLDIAGNNLVVGIELDPSKTSRFDINSSPYLKDRGVILPDNLFVKVSDAEEVETLCDRKNEYPGNIYGCLLTDYDKYLAIIQNIGGPKQEALTTHEVIHAGLIKQAQTDETMSNLNQGDIELLTRYLVLNDAVYKIALEKGWDFSDPQLIRDHLRQIEIVGASLGDQTPTEAYFSYALKVAGGVQANSDSSRYLAQAMLNHSIEEMIKANMGLSRSYFGERLFDMEEYRSLRASLMSAGMISDAQALMANYEVTNLP